MSTPSPTTGWQPGQVLYADEPIELNVGRERRELTVVNDGDRPVQVGSHYHFAEANPALLFDRVVARGKRLDIAAGTSVRFEPGVTLLRKFGEPPPMITSGFTA